MGEVIDMQSWRARRGAAHVTKPTPQPSPPLRLRVGLAAMLGLPLIVTLLALAR